MSGVDKIVDSHNLSENDDTGNVSTETPTFEEEWEVIDSAVEDFAAEHQPLDILGGGFGVEQLADIGPNEMGIYHEGDIGNSKTDNPPPERKISDCIESLESFSETRCGLGSSSNSARSNSPPDHKAIFIANPGENGIGGSEEIVPNVINEENIVETLIKLRSGHYTASGDPEELVYSNCKYLFEKDYHCEYVDNFGGILSVNYPVRLIVPIKRKSAKEGSKGAPFDKIKYAEMVKFSCNARLRRRFVAPVILFDDKFICRSATLSVEKTAIYESAIQPEPPKADGVEDNWIVRSVSNIFQIIIARPMKIVEAVSTHIFDPSSMEKIRQVDRITMKNLNVEYICDLTIEERKMFLNLIAVGSSEKINTGIYDFKIDQLPYPGCEFFERYSRVGRNPNGLIFNWERADCKTELLLELNDIPPNINWHDYKEWDVVVLTKNYLKVMLSRLIKGTGGLLVHCVSGWDRTPLMISLLRVSLWADGVAHQNLTLIEMAYLTLTYDWYLFGHNFPDRKQKREEIMHFCFNFLSRIATDEFSITKMFENLSCLERYEGKFPAFEPGRREVLNNFSVLVLNIYNQHIRFPVV